MGHIHYRSQESFFHVTQKTKSFNCIQTSLRFFTLIYPSNYLWLSCHVKTPRDMGPKSQLLYWRISEKGKIDEERIMYIEGRKMTLTYVIIFKGT